MRDAAGVQTNPGQDKQAVAPAQPISPAGEPARAALGSFLRGILNFVEKKHLGSQVRARVSPETIKLMDHPPFVFRWVGSTPIDEIEAALQVIGGPELCHDLGLDLSSAIGGSIVQPVLRVAFFLFGETPEAVFAHLDRFFSLPIRGITFSWRPMVQGVGVVEARFNGDKVPEAAFHVLQGSLQWVFDDLLKRPGSVGPVHLVHVDETEARVTFEVRF